MTTRDDVELLRSFSRRHWSPTGGMVAYLANSRQAVAEVAETLHAVVRLYKDDSLRGVRFAKSDLVELCVTLNAVPMTVEQREAVDSGLRKLGDAHREGSERHAEMAIETITEEIGIHNYHDAARAVLATWRAAVQIREDHGLPTEPSAVAASAANMAVAVAKDRDAIKTLHGIFCTTTVDRLVEVTREARAGSADVAYLVGIKNKWHAWHTNNPPARAQMRVLDILRALRESMDEPLTEAIDETIEVLDHLFDSVPF